MKKNNKQTIRLTESQLHQVIKESVKKVINEAYLPQQNTQQFQVSNQQTPSNQSSKFSRVCPNCGFDKLLPTYKFCPKCHQPLPWAKQETEEEQRNRVVRIMQAKAKELYGLIEKSLDRRDLNTAWKLSQALTNYFQKIVQQPTQQAQAYQQPQNALGQNIDTRVQQQMQNNSSMQQQMANRIRQQVMNRLQNKFSGQPQ